MNDTHFSGEDSEGKGRVRTLERVPRPDPRDLLLPRQDGLGETLASVGVREVLLEVFVGDEGLRRVEQVRSTFGKTKGRKGREESRRGGRTAEEKTRKAERKRRSEGRKEEERKEGKRRTTPN